LISEDVERGAGYEMALDVESVVDGGVSGEEALDAGVRGKDAVRQPNDSVQIEVLKQLFFDPSRRWPESKARQSS
jgi:hypothetical protein